MMKKFTKNKKTGYILIVVIIFGVLAVIFYNRASLLEGSDKPLTEDEVQSYILQLAPAQTSYISNVGGTVTSVHTDAIVIDYVSPQATTAAPYTVSVNSETKVYKQQRKDPAVLWAEQETFVAQGSRGVPPLPFIPQPISLTGLKEGDLVTIRLSEPQGIQSVQYALEIGVIPSL